MEQRKPQTTRRTNASIDEAIMIATKEVIEEVGFAKATLKDIYAKAKIEPNTFYRRFENIDALFEHFAKQYDFWLNETVPLQFKGNKYAESYENCHTELAKNLYENKAMQQLLIWGISEDNNITRCIAEQREAMSQKILESLTGLFEDTNIDITAVTALLIGGIYYLILHKDRTTFCGIDFSKKKGKKRLMDAINNIVTGVFSAISQENEKEVQIAKNLKQENVPNEIIAKATGLSLDIISAL